MKKLTSYIRLNLQESRVYISLLQMLSDPIFFDGAFIKNNESGSYIFDFKTITSSFSGSKMRDKTIIKILGGLESKGLLEKFIICGDTFEIVLSDVFIEQIENTKKHPAVFFMS